MPIGDNGDWSKEHCISNNIVLEKYPNLIPIINKDKSAPAQHYKLPGAKGRVGLINPISSHFCSSCNRIRLTADGKIKPCLHSNDEVDIKTDLREKRDILPIIVNAVKIKPKEHHMNEKNYNPINREMVQIGG
jgi:Molybdenum cofactor biosynthesis enzyme